MQALTSQIRINNNYLFCLRWTLIHRVVNNTEICAGYFSLETSAIELKL